MKFEVTLKNGVPYAESGYGDLFVLTLGSGDPGPVGHPAGTLRFERQGGKIARVFMRRGTTDFVFHKQEGKPAPAAVATGNVDEDKARVTRPADWPSFRGLHASGVADGQHPPIHWDVAKGVNVRWKVEIPGLAHSSPVIWGDRVFLTSAVPSEGKPEFKPGLYGAGTSAKDLVKHAYRVYALDRRTGKELWAQTAYEGVPKVKRHIKSSHANPTPATDGTRLVVSFASEGLYCYDLEGRQLWRRDLGVLDDGAFNDPEIQWGAASSPVIWRDLVIVQCDRQKDSYIAAFRLDDGQPAWRTARDEVPSWGTPTLVEGAGRTELLTNGTNFVRAYDPATGKELWRLSGNSEITVPTPVAGEGLVFVTSGYHPIQPIFAVLPGGQGDISLKAGVESNDRVAWSKKRGGPYMPTPIVYRRHLYTCSNNGMLACYEARTGNVVYQQRLGGGGYSASPVAADGRLYFAGEDGDVRVVRAGPEFALLAVNRMDDPCMASPAISDGTIFVRTQHALYAIGRSP